MSGFDNFFHAYCWRDDKKNTLCFFSGVAGIGVPVLITIVAVFMAAIGVVLNVNNQSKAWCKNPAFSLKN